MAEEKKGVFEKLKENITDKEEQLTFISVVVRLVVVAWSGFIVSLNYITLPGYSNVKLYPWVRYATWIQ